MDYQTTDSFITKMKLLISKRWHVGLLLVVILIAAGYWVNSLKDAQAAPVNPVVSGIPGEVIGEEGTFAPIDLSLYVTDEDSDITKLTWKAAGNTDLVVDIVESRVDITYPARWTGTETITFTATDESGNEGSGDATFTVTTASEPPVVSDIPNHSKTTISVFPLIMLDSYVADADTADADITWTASGQVNCTANIVTRSVRVDCPGGWTGAETITFTATDPQSNSDSDSAVFTVTAPLYSPVASDIPAQTVTVGTAFETISLDSYVADSDTADASLTWAATGQTECTVTIAADTRVASVACPDAWTGAETITFTATDPGDLTDSDSAVFTVEAAPEVVVESAPATPVATGSPLPSVAFSSPINFPMIDKAATEPASSAAVTVGSKDQPAAEVKAPVLEVAAITGTGQSTAASNPTITKMEQVFSSAAATAIRSEELESSTSIGTEVIEVGVPSAADAQKIASLPPILRPIGNDGAGGELAVVQERLKSYGFMPEQVTTAQTLDAPTRAAVSEFQTAVGINPLGIVGPRTTKALNGQEFISNVTYVFASIIKQGERGEEVQQLQTRLRDQGFFPYDVPSTGWYGPITRVAVETFQKVYALPITGLVDEATRALLNVFSRSS